MPSQNFPYAKTLVRAEHVGSLLRPPPLLKQRHLYGQGLCTRQELAVAEDTAVAHVLNLQCEVGMRSLTDGEVRREVFFEGVFENLEGMKIVMRPITHFKKYIPHIKLMYAAGLTESESVYCSGKIKRRKAFYAEQFKSLKRLVRREDVKLIKITMCSPSWFHQRHGSDLTYDLDVYKNDDEYFEDIGKAYREEIRELYELGCRRIQIDDPTFCYFCNDTMISEMQKAGVNPDALLDTYIRAINLCVQDRPSDLTIGLHMCRGNFKGGVHFTEGGYGRIARKAFNDLDVDVFYLEYDTERSGDFAPLKHFPLNKVAVLGLVTTKSGKLEASEVIRSRVHEAAEAMARENPHRSKSVALNQLCVSTQCGFASVWEGNPLTEADEKQKLALLVKVAAEIWGA
ncbi:UROD/MetE-like superfamily protein [Pleurotus pulmonarius]|nr:hypothetical protein EYR36_007491 [Pleurotus pulmonarius]